MNFEEIRFSGASSGKGSLVSDHIKFPEKKYHHIVLYSEQLEDINILLEGKIDKSKSEISKILSKIYKMIKIK